MALDRTHVKVHRCAGGRKRGASEQAIGVTKGGRNSNLHALWISYADRGVIISEARQRRRLHVGSECVSLTVGIRKPLGDKAYNSDPFRE